jgi:flagellar hook assembly protein FlgD
MVENDILMGTGILAAGEINNARASNSPQTYCYPNPFCTSVFFEIRTANSEQRNINVGIYDITGKLVHQFDQRGSHSAFRSSGYAWDGRNNLGQAAAPGLYFIRLKTDKNSYVKSIVKSK